MKTQQMTLASRIGQRFIGTVMIIILFLGVGLFSCLAQGFENNPYSSGVVNAGKEINHHDDINLEAKSTKIKSVSSPYEEIKPSLTPCGKKLYFSRYGHPENTASKIDNEDIWYSAYDDESQEWSQAVRLPGILNNSGHNFVNSISMTGDTIILGNEYLKKGKMRAGLSFSVNIRGQWSDPTPIHIKNNYNISDHSNAFVCLKTGVIISAVQRDETFGGRDLYVSFWNGSEATEPINMGAIINTDLEESSPYLASDNKTLYFASKGHNGHGGFDVFVTRRLDNSWTSWSEPENLGPAVNGSLDDEHFSISHCGNYGVFSKQVSVHNVDLFKVSIDELFSSSTPIASSEIFKGKGSLVASRD
jgi:OOP family OmpA-OmpF porin